MANLDPYLFFDGNCAEAMRFYEKTLGGKLDLMKAGDSPAAGEMPPGSADKILHARLALEDRAVMASDWMGGDQPYAGMKGFALALGYTAVDEARRVFDALAEGGQVNMPMQKTFWVESFGMLVDRFGTSWMVSGGKPAGA
jgi:PhnB protein